jgi:hypothetical protein
LLSSKFKEDRKQVYKMCLADEIFEGIPLAQHLAEATATEASFSMENFAEANCIPGVGRLDDTGVGPAATELESNRDRCEQDMVASPTPFAIHDIGDVDVTHPCKLVDYHLYLHWFEQGKDQHHRRNCMYLFDGHVCTPFTYAEFLESKKGQRWQSPTGQDQKLLFAILPVVKHEPHGARFDGRHYVLGYDLEIEEFFVRYFEWVPDLSDIGTVWYHGTPMYFFSMWALYSMMKKSLNNDGERVEIEHLSVSTYCGQPEHHEDPGLEIVIVVQCCQWLLDFADIILPREEWFNGRVFKDQLVECMSQWRLVLDHASYKAWNDARNKPPREVYYRRKWIELVNHELYSFDDSKSVRSLHDEDWHVFSQEACDAIRKDSWGRYQKGTQQYFRDVFMAPNSESNLYEAEMLKRFENDHGCVMVPPPATPSGEPASQGVEPSPPATEGRAQNGEDPEERAKMLIVFNRLLDSMEVDPEVDSDTESDGGDVQLDAGNPADNEGEGEGREIIPFRVRRIRWRRDSGYNFPLFGS